MILYFVYYLKVDKGLISSMRKPESLPLVLEEMTQSVRQPRA